MPRAIRPALSTELPGICSRMAAMDPWRTLGIDALRLENGIRSDADRTTLVWDDGGVGACIGFRPTRGLETLLKLGAGPILALTQPSGRDNGCSPCLCAPDGGYVNLLAVFPEFQGRGCGAELLSIAEAEAVAAGSDRLYLCVSGFNAAGQRFYARQGYAHIGSIENCIRPGNTERLMLKLLRPSR